MKQNHKFKSSKNNSFQGFGNKYIPQIDSCIKNFFSNKIKNSESGFFCEFYNDLKSFCLREGKRIRPLLLIASYLGYSKGAKGIAEIVKISSSLEIMHSMLLMQDDIIDRSILRRGEKTLHVLMQEKYSERTKNSRIGTDIALVLADVLFANALEVIYESNIDAKIKNEFLMIFSKTYELTAWGQVLDSLNSLPVKIDDYDMADEIGKLKTAYYTIYFPVLMGKVLAGNFDKKEDGRIKDFAIPLGQSYQIRDDILGVFGDKKIIGKSPESDIFEGKLTHLIIDTVNEYGEREKDRFISIFSKEEKTDGDVQYLKRSIEESNSLTKAKERFNNFISIAKIKLPTLKMKKELMMVFSDFIDLMEIS